ncbi:MAG: aromatic amino acid lyase, partial [Clostridiales bacterium]|nr:aromatic amino acid lyase [Clostridiales bacterium]
MQKPDHLETLTIDGRSLTLGDFIDVARFSKKVQVSPVSIELMRRSRSVVEDIVKSGRPAYGINTGFGDFSRVSISREDAST